MEHTTENKTEKTESNSNKISKDMIIADIVNNHPYLAPYIMDYGVHCIGCGIATMETLEEGFTGHGISPEEIDQAIEELNKIIEENEKNSEK
jgi:hydroxylamine reductase